MADIQYNEAPWYRHVWVWFLIALPASAVIAGTITILIATSQPEALVVDDYAKIGLATKRDSKMELRASQLELQARIQLNLKEQLLSLYVQSNQSAQKSCLRVLMLHPTLSQYDNKLELCPNEAGLYQGSYEHPIISDVYIRIESEQAGWRLAGRLKKDKSHIVLLARNQDG